MSRKKTILLFIIAFNFLFTSCLQVGKEVVDWMDAKNTDEAFGTYHYLDGNNSEVYLPEEFKKYSISKYQKILDSLIPKDQLNFEFDRLNNLNDMKGEFYIFFDKSTNSTCTLNTMPYIPITKREAQQFLGLMRINSEKATRGTDINFNKITAKYTGTPDNCIFKSVYKTESEKVNFYTSTFFITSNNKTLFIQLSTPFEAYFDPFIKKIRM